jgi:nitroreductase
MTNTIFEQVQSIIKNRRSVKTASMNGKAIPDETVTQLLELAHWAPTHGRTEPWHFFVYTGAALTQFGKTHADLHQQNTPEEKRNPATHDKLLHNGDGASHLIIAVMKRGANEKIPQIEELAAASAAVENLLIGASAAGIASFWSSGGLTHSHVLKEHLQLGAEDHVLGLIYLGYTDEPAKDGVRNAPVEAKVTWVK